MKNSEYSYWLGLITDCLANKEITYFNLGRLRESIITSRNEQQNEHGDDIAAELAKFAHDLRSAQKNYMADRGNEELGKIVAEAAKNMDNILLKYESYGEK